MLRPLRAQRSLHKATLQCGHIGGEDDFDKRGAVALGGALELLDEFGLREELSYVHIVTGVELRCYDGDREAPGVVSGRGHVRIPLAQGVLERIKIESEVERSVLCQLMGDRRLASARRPIYQDHPCHTARLALNLTGGGPTGHER